MCNALIFTKKTEKNVKNKKLKVKFRKLDTNHSASAILMLPYYKM